MRTSQFTLYDLSFRPITRNDRVGFEIVKKGARSLSISTFILGSIVRASDDKCFVVETRDNGSDARPNWHEALDLVLRKLGKITS